MDIGSDKVYCDIRRMSEQENSDKQYELCYLVAGHCAEQVYDGSYNAG